MRNRASVLDKDSHKHICDFHIETEPLLSARRPKLITNKKI